MIDGAHDYQPKPIIGMLQYCCNITNKIKSAFNQTLKSINKTKQLWFKPQHTVRLIKDNSAVMITYNSGADGHYISEKDREAARLPILRPSTKRVMIADGEKSKENTSPVYLFRRCHQKQDKQTRSTNSPRP